MHHAAPTAVPPAAPVVGNRGAKEVWLAPMEGLLDHGLRDTLTQVPGVQMCVSEFIRVTNTVLPRRAFLRVAPELFNASRTPSGVPVRVQLLGSDPDCLADNAAVLAKLAPAGIDLNFGCPAKTVNQHRGGAVLLDEPELVGRIVQAVRRAVPAHIPVSAKMRLGYMDDSRAEDCAQAIESAGASDLVVHARTKAQGYKAPAYWERIGDLRQCVKLPMVANGEIWTLADALRCREVSGCDRLMIGRGMVANPGLALAIARHDAGQSDGPELVLSWSEVKALMPVFWQSVTRRVTPKHRAGRMKQWLNYLRRSYPQAQTAFDAMRLVHDASRFDAWIKAD